MTDSTAPARVLVVCTGNICRSPMAAALLDRRLRDGGWPVEVTSAGTMARTGDPATHGMQAVAGEHGLDLSGHWSQPVTSRLAREADLIVVMEERHRRRVGRLHRSLPSRTFLLTELEDLLARPDLAGDTRPPGDSGPDRLSALRDRLNASREARPARAQDVADPYGGSDADYRACASELDARIGAVATALITTMRG